MIKNAENFIVPGDGFDVSVDDDLDYDFPEEEVLATQRTGEDITEGVTDEITNLTGDDDSEIVLGTTGSP